ncbi:MAG: putative copper-exporting P-type ATPase A [Methanoregula sp. PtaU1.Bin051]|nr:MAG: putative copper-exporting P-type ATPase A [Methanoregula sp. PtaU1.Bin051]
MISSYDDAMEKFGTVGISEEDVASRRMLYGSNELTPPFREPVIIQYLRKYNEPITRILIIAVILSAVLAFFQGEGLLDTLGIVIAILLSTTMSFYNEYRSSREFEVLNAQRDMSGTKVIRSGSIHIVPVKEIVSGDLVLIEAGDAIPADGYLLASDAIRIDESAFSGESEPVLKTKQERVRKGTFVTAGRGHLLVTAVGDATDMGVIAASLGKEDKVLTPLEQKLQDLATMISRFGYFMAILVIGSLVVRGLFTGELTGANLQTAGVILHYFMVAVVIIVVAVPEGLPMSVALSLSIAMRKMTRANSLVRRLIACETIGSATTICTDKTGTLTKNQMTVEESSFGNPGIPIGVLPATAKEWVGLNAALNSTAYLEQKDGRLVAIGNVTEGALLIWLWQNDIDYHKIRDEFTLHKQFLFDGSRKRMSTVVEMGGKQYLLVKGAPEIIALLCAEPVDLSGIKALALRAMRTLAFAHKEITDGDETETALVWDGYVGIRDPLRENVPASVESCRHAGIIVRMVTGDNADTARTIASEAGIFRTGQLLTGKEFREMNEDQRILAARSLEVMARAEPFDKLLLVHALQKTGQVVAVTGDGINDAPALKHADVGLSMGITGTEVAREASDIILLDDSFPTIVKAVWWGRALFENIQRFLVFQLTINISACFLTLLLPLIGYPPPFTIIQILWINIIMDSVAALALCSEAPHAALMYRSPVPRDAPILTRRMWQSIMITAGFYIIAGTFVITTGLLGGSSATEQATIFFSAFVLSQVWNGINCRAIDGIMPPFFSGNPVFFLLMGLIVIIQVILVQFGGDLIGTVPLSLIDWTRIALASTSVLILGAIIRFFYANASSVSVQ